MIANKAMSEIDEQIVVQELEVWRRKIKLEELKNTLLKADNPFDVVEYAGQVSREAASLIASESKLKGLRYALSFLEN